MRLKTLIVSVVILAVLSGVVYFVRRPAPPAVADNRLNQAVVDQATIEQAAKLRISDQGRTVTVVRDGTGTWRVPEYHDLRADFTKLAGFIGNLTDAKLQRLVTSNAERMNRLEFKDTKVELLDASDKVLWSLTIGKYSESGGGRYVRFGDEQKAYLANLNAWIDPEAKNWANSELLNLKADDVARVEISFAEGNPVIASRGKKEDPWTAEQTPEGQKLKADKISTTLSSLGNIRFTDTTSHDDPNVVAAKANPRTVKLTSFDNKTVTIALGRKPEEKKLKPPSPTTDGKTGPAALGSVNDLAKADEKKAGETKAGDASAGTEPKSDDKPLAPEFETVPAGPVFAFIQHSDAAAPVNAMMEKRAFQVADYIFTSLPQKRDELFEAAPAPADAKPAADEKAAPAEAAKP